MVPTQKGPVLHRCTKFQADSCFRSKAIKGSRSLEIRLRDPRPRPLWVGLYSVRWRGPSSISVPNLKLIAEFVQKLLRGPQISKLGHVTLSHAPFEPETLNLCRNPYYHACCKILCF